MAVALSPGRRRIDPFGGAADLERGVIRELHARSFLDDPTRAFRAVRYANRLGFRIHPATRRAISAAPAHRALARVSGDRVRREIRLIFEEPRRGRATAQLGALGLAQALEPSLRADRPAAGRVARAEAFGGAGAGDVTWLCYLLAWMWQAGEGAVGRVAERLALVGAEGRVLRRWPDVAGRLARATVPEDVSPDELVAAASSLPARRAPRAAREGGGARHSPLHPWRGPRRGRHSRRPGRRRGARADAGSAPGRPDREEGRARLRAGRGAGGSSVTASFFLLAAALAAGPTPTATPEPPPGPTFCVEWIRQSSEGYDRLTLFRDRHARLEDAPRRQGPGQARAARRLRNAVLLRLLRARRDLEPSRGPAHGPDRRARGGVCS